MTPISILLIVLTFVSAISIAFAISFYLDKRHLKRQIERLSNTINRDRRDRQLLTNRERDLNLEVFRLNKKLRKEYRI